MPPTLRPPRLPRPAIAPPPLAEQSHRWVPGESARFNIQRHSAAKGNINQTVAHRAGEVCDGGIDRESPDPDSRSAPPSPGISKFVGMVAHALDRFRDPRHTAGCETRPCLSTSKLASFENGIERIDRCMGAVRPDDSNPHAFITSKLRFPPFDNVVVRIQVRRAGDTDCSRISSTDGMLHSGQCRSKRQWLPHPPPASHSLNFGSSESKLPLTFHDHAHRHAAQQSARTGRIEIVSPKPCSACSRIVRPFNALPFQLRLREGPRLERRVHFHAIRAPPAPRKIAGPEQIIARLECPLAN